MITYIYIWKNIPGHEPDSLIKISPNPTKGLIYFAITNGNGCIAELADLTGKIFKTISLDTHGHLDISGFQNGLYILNIRDKYKIIDKGKIIKN